MRTSTACPPHESGEKRSNSASLFRPHREDPRKKPTPEPEPEKKPTPEPEPEKNPAPEPEHNTTPTPGSETATILEKGLIYFFVRPRVSTPHPTSLTDIARSYFILRPTDATAGPKPTAPSRLCVVPKKVLPTSGRQRWIGFVEKGHEPYRQAVGEDLAGREYETKTMGERRVPDAIPAGEGIYALTHSRWVTYLVYILTEPRELGEVQRGLGLKERGYFTISTRNPVYPAPKGVGFPQNAKYSQE